MLKPIIVIYFKHSYQHKTNTSVLFAEGSYRAFIMRTLKKSLLSLTVASLLATPLLVSAEGFGTISANAALTTDYYFRGISQTLNDGAVQGGFDWAHDSGVYAGVWASNIDFGDEANIEVDTYLGFANDIGDSGFSYDVNVLRYNYDDVDYDTNEYTIALSYSYFTAAYKYSDDWLGSDESSNYVSLGFEYDLPADFALSISVGNSFGDAYDKNTDIDFDYIDYKIGISRDYYGLSWDLSYVGNDLNSKECAAYVSGKSICDDKLILTVSKGIDDVSKSSEGSDLPITANVALVTDYYFRGISQTLNDGAVQGGFDYAHDSGIYAGVWASNVDFGDEASLEVDTYIGFANDIGDSGFSYDVNFLRYNYDDVDYSTNELTFGLGYSYFNVAYKYSDDWLGSDESSNYISLGFNYDLPADFALSASVGNSFGDAYDKNTDTDFDYVDYKIGVSKDYVGVSFDLSYVGNDLNSKECSAYVGGNSICDDKLILTVSKGF